MYIILPIALVFFFVTWLILRRFTKIWINRSLTFIESSVAGIAAWLHIFSIIAWFGGIVFTVLEFLSTHETEDIWAILFAVLLTGYGIDFIIRSGQELRLDETKEFIKEAIQFRRSAQHRLDLISLIRQKQLHRKPFIKSNTPESQQRARLQLNLDKEKELDAQIELLKENTVVDISESYRINVKMQDRQGFSNQVEEVRIEPNRKRLTLIANFPELNETLLQDDMIVLRFNRQVYDFLQFLNSEPWLKPYTQFFESYFLICRAIRATKDGSEILYPFMRIGILASELRKLEGSYFNPRKLSEIAALAFNNGSPV